jgi:hypothetical protein
MDGTTGIGTFTVIVGLPSADTVAPTSQVKAKLDNTGTAARIDVTATGTDSAQSRVKPSGIATFDFYYTLDEVTSTPLALGVPAGVATAEGFTRRPRR